MRRSLRALPVAAALLVAAVAAGCGSSSSSSGGASTTPTSNNAGAKNGGNVTLLDAAGSVDSLDPGYWYYQTDYTELGQTTQRTLYAFRPTDTTPQPDLATGQPAISNGGKTLTFHIRSGIHYSPPLQNQTVQAADIKYAMERCYAANVGNGYAFTYYNRIVGAPSAPTKTVPDVSGIQAPDPTTLVINTTQPVGILAIPNALALYCTTPIPKSYAAKFDSGAQSSYGQHAVATGPYMIAGSGTGTVPSSGYQPGKLLALVRNPSWQKSTDPIRPAHFDTITVKGGYDVSVASRQILDGQSLMSGDYAVPPSNILQQGLTGPQRNQFQITPSGGNRIVSLNATIKPLDNINFRRAIAAAINRNALRLTRGGPAVGTVATHFIPPQMPGFDQAGGKAGPGYDFYANPNGNLALAHQYLKKAGFASGMYSGPPMLVVADNTAPAKNTAEAVQQQLSQIGITMNLREVPHATMLSKFCNVPKAAVVICPNLGWGKDFFDSQSMITPVAYGPNIVPTGNTNWAQINNPAWNTQMDQASQILSASKRATAWGNLDKEITGGAYYITWLWDNEVGFHSSNVNGVQWPFNGGDWDLTASSLK